MRSRMRMRSEGTFVLVVEDHRDERVSTVETGLLLALGSMEVY